MLKFIKYHMTEIEGIEIYPIISFIIFFTFFAFVLIYVVRADKKTIEEIANIPLNSNESDHEEA